MTAPSPPEAAAALLDQAAAREREGALAEATSLATAAAELAEESGDVSTLCRSLRRLAVLHHHQGDPVRAQTLCQRSFALAETRGESVLAAEALNTEAALAFESGAIEAARQTYARAVALGGSNPGLRARVEQNLGILANIQGDLDSALAHYRTSLEAYAALQDERGRGLVLHNLGMLSADRARWDDADEYFQTSRMIAESLGESHLAALCALNHSEVHLARQRFELARTSAEAALAAFERIGSRLDKADAYRILGTIYRETGRFTLSESRLRTARELAAESGSTLSEAEATRELALLHQAMGRNQDALTLLCAAHRLFSRLDARLDLVDVGGKREKLEATYLAVVREWGESIESADSYTFGHCERVARYAVSVAEVLELDEATITTIRLGAYLHDVGKIRVPHEILN
jgi:HD-GYP domain-containing protein (c-di-GMP phosphodiesterase class II)